MGSLGFFLSSGEASLGKMKLLLFSALFVLSSAKVLEKKHWDYDWERESGTDNPNAYAKDCGMVKDARYLGGALRIGVLFAQSIPGKDFKEFLVNRTETLMSSTNTVLHLMRLTNLHIKEGNVTFDEADDFGHPWGNLFTHALRLLDNFERVNEVNADRIFEEAHHNLHRILREIGHMDAEHVKHEVLMFLHEAMVRCKRIAQEGCVEEKPTDAPDYWTTDDHWYDSTAEDHSNPPWYDHTTPRYPRDGSTPHW